MTDKEVGELWQCAGENGCGNFSKAEVQQVIRKIVEERAFFRYYTEAENGRYEDQRVQWIHIVLRDFGIDPATWK